MFTSEMNYFRAKYILYKYSHYQPNIFDKSKVLLEKENADGSMVAVKLYGHDEPQTKFEDVKNLIKGCNICDGVTQKLAECEVCTNPIQNTNVMACNTCAGIWCGGCAKKIKKCPFCRGIAPKTHCEPISRMLKDMNLPCKFFRNGCTTLLKGFDRKEHEESCYFANMLCPMIYCKCIPPRPELVRHLQLAHEMITVDTSRLKLNLFSYRENVHDKEEKRYRYNLHLISFGFLFSIDVYVFRLEFEIRMRMKKIKREKEPNGFLCSNVVLVELSCEKYVLRKSVIVTETKEKECLFQIDNAVINKAVNDGVGLTFTVSEMK